MSEQTPNTSLAYRDSNGEPRSVEGCRLSVDKAGKFWLWSDQLDSNLAYKAKTREDCLLDAISSLLFSIALRDERIGALQRIADLANQFADQIKPDEELL